MNSDGIDASNSVHIFIGKALRQALYAATDFNLAGGEPEHGYKQVLGLILLEGGGASRPSEPPDEATLDLMEARFDGR